ncbi:hypothetical protein A3C59_00915 [Candidatus Daviesbacteria bacterium RIFCSPHIGHO2_02_FULL_36_13]|uniref:YdbS-like PH domain-containing protein n=1 Tax=Candidatus Daviesbacteria bacterium RIFCSPHIGHO2_02_FULL_36_13 TaxID=1797768 RepID=A0A1F5JYR4_9BACT|nr:MAG: hypothetical protein A3C59_00915 [Candidatus Daviesbacteria bacterium RIFCSPHIGHO2_02_FULL_36_13]
MDNSTERNETIFALTREGKKHFTVSHLTIRQSIFFLLLQLIVVEILTVAVAFVFFSSALFPISFETKVWMLSYNGVYLILLASLKIGFSGYVILLWLNNYYEVTTEMITHKTGIIWQKEQGFKVTHIKNYGIRQGIFGRVFNYGTLYFYDWFLKQEYTMYLIHSPKKYYRILKDLLPFADEDREMVREYLVEPSEA